MPQRDLLGWGCLAAGMKMPLQWGVKLPVRCSKAQTGLFFGMDYSLLIHDYMSQAFVKETEGEWLHDVLPTLTALTGYLTRENNGIRVYEKANRYSEKEKREVHVMSNGFSYAKDDDGRWYIAE